MATDRVYGYAGSGSELAPNYERVVQALNDADLEDEILSGLGEPGYRLALLTEHDRRARLEGGGSDADRR